MTTEICSICKKPSPPKLIQQHSSDGLVRMYHEGKCLDEHLRWENYNEEKQTGDYGITTSSDL
jgi:hypothetical protein